MKPLVILMAALAALLLTPVSPADDLVELKSGTQVRGKLISEDDKYVQIEITVNGKTYTRRYPQSIVVSVTKDAAPGTDSGPAGVAVPVRSVAEVQELIRTQGSSPPDWLESTQLNFPNSLDLSWPMPAPQPWNNSKNVGQFIWDRINPNPGQWRNGVKLMHHIMSVHQNDRRVARQAMSSLGNMYHNLFEDYARAAYWWQQAGVADGRGEPNATVHLADCYFRLGNKDLALQTIRKMPRQPYAAIKLMGDIGETDQALRMAEAGAKAGNAVVCYLYAGDVCRVAGRLDDAESYYRKALAAADDDHRNKNHSDRDRGRAQASLAAIQFFRLSPRDVTDGTYTASSLGYEDQIEVRVTVAGGRMTDVAVTKHREKQFYSSIDDTPRNLVARQAFVGVDTTSGATITSEAIINATAQALAAGKR